MPTANHNELSTLLLSARKQHGLNAAVVYRGSSMLPLLHNGYMLTIDCNSLGIKAGDIIVFESNRQLVAHRVLSARFKNGQLYYIEKGDNQLIYNSIAHEYVLGKVVAVNGAAKWLSVTGGNYAANYIFAKFSYILAAIYGSAEKALRTIAGTMDLPGGYAVRKICLRGSHAFLRLLLCGRDV
jgi:signal peptidase I